MAESHALLVAEITYLRAKLAASETGFQAMRAHTVAIRREMDALEDRLAASEAEKDEWERKSRGNARAFLESNAALVEEKRKREEAERAHGTFVLAVAAIAEELLCGADIACEHTGITGLEGALKLKLILPHPPAKKSQEKPQ